MLEPLKHLLKTQRIILASGSPRRKEILGNINLLFEVIPSTFEENLDPKAYSNPGEFVVDTARHKALQISFDLKGHADVVIGADTTIAVDGDIIGKPKDDADAINILSRLRGRDHQVFTGVVLVMGSGADQKVTSFYERTDVTMAQLSDDVVRAYVQTGEPSDKAGGYGIQALGGTLISGIKGDYFNVMGFPLHRFCVEFTKVLTAEGH